MSRARRLGTVVRIREIQERVAEVEAERRRRELTDRQATLEQAHSDLAERAGADAAVSSRRDLVARRDSLGAVLVGIADRTDDVTKASVDHRAALDEYHVAHRAHEAVARLHDRHSDAERLEEMRRSQVELDDLVVVRHGRSTPQQEIR